MNTPHVECCSLFWHDITNDEVQVFSSTNTERNALNTAMFTIDEIEDELQEILKGE